MGSHGHRLCLPWAVLLVCCFMLCSAGGSDKLQKQGEIRTPIQLLGDCTTVWTSGYEKYLLPYTARFHEHGEYDWVSPFRKTSGEEVGTGQFLTPVHEIHRSDGSWEVHYFSATRYTPGDVTTCCCEYVRGTDANSPRILSDYCRADVPGRSQDSMLEVCSPYMTEPCPADNATAYELMGAPFIEVYANCTSPSLFPFMRSWEAILLLALAVFAGALLSWKAAGDRSHDYQAFKDSEGGGPLLA